MFSCYLRGREELVITIRKRLSAKTTIISPSSCAAVLNVIDLFCSDLTSVGDRPGFNLVMPFSPSASDFPPASPLARETNPVCGLFFQPCCVFGV
jgi:hypothetical protein